MRVLRKEFPLVEPDFPVLCKIFPTAQHAAAKAIRYAQAHDVDRVIIFGSATSWRFGPRSDIDICFDTDLPIAEVMKDMSLLLMDDIEFDLLIYKNCKGLLKSEIDKGVVIYDRAFESSRE